jgi:rRNA biogenesis protein RRP5
MSFRTKSSTTSKDSLLTLRDFQEGQIVYGHVKKLEDYGLFIELDDSKVSGLCHKSEVGPVELELKLDTDAGLAIRY